MKKASETEPVTLDELRQMATSRFGDMVKAVVDLRRGVMLLAADRPALLHQGRGAGVRTRRR